tara:strand:- start:2415 stop:3017 length:603 start_codon:yes stop_codon:yes gene_type:complete
MRNIERGGKYWTLTILRNGKDEDPGGLEASEFRFGRFTLELSDSEIDATRIPSGLMTAVRASGIEEEALETGFVVEMRDRKQEDPRWVEFSSTATVSDPSPWGRSRTLYSCGECSTLEFIKIHSCSSRPVDLPGRIWVRACELPAPVVLWAMDNGVYDVDKSRQMKLDHWFGIPGQTPAPSDDKVIPMPGPNGRSYGFLG